ncbi:MAG: nucleoside 2-deoxyribosyltransferase [Thermoguttaceae bacterium]
MDKVVVKQENSMGTLQPFRHLRRVYCAGPLFNHAERMEMCQIAEALRTDDFEPFLPHEEIQFAEVHPLLVEGGLGPAEAGQVLHEAIFALDVYFVILGCGSLVLNLNGRVPDEGAVAEATMAWMLGKPMVFYKADSRSLIEGRDNPILAGQTGFEQVNDFGGIGAALERAIEEADLDPGATASCPAGVGQTLQMGLRFLERLEALGPGRPPGPTARIVYELFGRSGRNTAPPLVLGTSLDPSKAP